MSYSPLIETLSNLIRINSINPAYPSGRTEAEIQCAVRCFFEERGIPIFEQQAAPGRANVGACLPGRQPGKRVVFEAHSDTAGVEGMTIPPFEPSADGRDLASVRHPLVGSPTLNVGTIRGGTQVNTVPDCCSIELDRRLVPGENHEEVLAHYATLVENTRSRHPNMEVEIEPPLLQDNALETPREAGIARFTAEVLRDLGLDPAPIGVPFGSDASKLAHADIQSIVLGPGSIELAHTAEEYVETEQVEQAMLVYRRIMTEFE